MLSDEDIKAFGRDAFGIDPTLDGNLMRYARAVERAAYERAAQECDEWMKHCQATIGGPLGAYREGKGDAASTLAERIRALGGAE